jgi:glycosyltransferase involved in cell wall biosynthesis
MTARRIAFFTPLNPLRTGISDHSAELLPFLAERFGAATRIDVVIDEAYEPSDGAIARRFEIVRASAFLRRAGDYDLAIYQLGNNLDHHAYMVEPMRVAPGVLVLQDYCLQYLALGLTLGRGDLESLRAMLRPEHGAGADRLARGLLLGLEDADAVTFARPFIENSRAVIVHSRYCLDVVRRDHPAALVREIIMGVTPIDPRPEGAASAEALREKHGFAADDFVLASVSTLSAKKRLHLVLGALRRLRGEMPTLRFLVVGGGAIGAKVRAMIRRDGLEDVVRQTGWVPAETYRDLIRLSDVVVDLRRTTGVETPNSLLRAMGAAKPAIVIGEGPFLEIPEEACIRIEPPRAETEHAGAGEDPEPLARAIAALARDHERRRRMGAAAGAYVRRDLSLARTAEGYAELLDELARAGPRPVSAGDAWSARPPSPARARLVKAAYRVCRLGYLYRSYGLRDTLRRLRGEVARRRSSTS